jgi:hypothetical protein
MAAEPRTTDSRERADGAGLFWFYDRDDLDITWREVAYAFLPAIAFMAGLWIALAWFLTTGVAA